MRFKLNAFLAAAVLAMGGAAASAATDAPTATAQPGAAAALTAGEVRKVDAAQGKVTIRHEPIANLDMPAMTMVFRIDTALLQGVKPGDRILFRAVQTGGAIKVVDLESIK